MWCTIISPFIYNRNKTSLTLLSTDCWCGLKGVLGTLFDPPPSHPVIHLVTPPWPSFNNWKIILKQKMLPIQERKKITTWFQKVANHVTWFQRVANHVFQVQFLVNTFYRGYKYNEMLSHALLNKSWEFISQNFSILI